MSSSSIPFRYVIAGLVFLACCVNLAARININVAMFSMVKHQTFNVVDIEKISVNSSSAKIVDNSDRFDWSPITMVTTQCHN